MGKVNVLKETEELCDFLKQTIKQKFNFSIIGMLPSTALATGYYENFLSKIYDSG